MFTLSEENYLKTIYHLGLNSEIGVSTNEIAKKMQTKASSVTDMIKKLSDKDLVVYKKYKGVKITDFGRNMAANIVRKHRLWEVFLVEKLNFSWDEVHEVAEQLEHIKSPKLINELDALLGFPKQDPHGDPIPDKEGNYYHLEKKLLATLGLGEKGICVGVNDSSSSFLQFLDKQKIALGNEIKVIGKEPFDDSIQIQVANRELSISNKIANNLYIKIL
ncbi:metal-dependent transcriptional regulator [Polaribacter sp.]|nr:metal-dependent transcriptional regulator [Polaribacter sp.]MDA9092388.1 metal-dependent transcriptional regulator [Polaribacter sp.]MDB4009797.1 metal-dependent transcriptional regulator [Polaribacter sp.]